MRYRFWQGQQRPRCLMSVKKSYAMTSSRNLDVVIGGSSSNGAFILAANDDLAPSNKEHGRLYHCGLAAAVRSGQNDESVRLSIGTAEIEIQRPDASKVTDRQRRDRHTWDLSCTGHGFAALPAWSRERCNNRHNRTG